MFYTFRQNNSGGSWHTPAITVIVEANTAREANERAETAGVYFNGVMSGQDCECCGSRWWEQYDDENCTKTPTLWGEEINLNESYSSGPFGINWGQEAGIPNFLIVYKDGTQKFVK